MKPIYSEEELAEIEREEREIEESDGYMMKSTSMNTINITKNKM